MSLLLTLPANQAGAQQKPAKKPPTGPAAAAAAARRKAEAAAEKAKARAAQRGETTPAAPPGEEEGVAKEYDEVVGVDYAPTSPRTRVTFNLEDADLPDLVRLVSQITGRRFILPGKARSIKATVYAPTKVTAAEAYQAFLSILELNGMAVVPAGRYLKIVESGRVEGRAIPLFTEEQGVPTGDRFLTRLHRVNYIPAEDAATLLERFKSGDGSLTAYAPTNMLIITDTGTNIRRMMRIMDVIDVARTGEQIWVEPVYHADATELATRLTEIFEPGESKAGTNNKKRAPKKGKKAPPPSATVGNAGSESRLTKIIADERTNSLIILATESAYLRILEMLKHLDVSMEGEGRIHVHRLQNSDAEEIASTLQSLVGGRGGGGKQKGKGAQEDTSVFQGEVAVTSHKASNALVITSSSHDYAALRGVIDELDSQRRQVFIEAVIMELGIDRSSSFGTSWHGGIPDFPTDESVSVLGFRALNTVGGLEGMAQSGEVLTGLAVGVQGPVIANSQNLVGLSLPGFGVAINAMASSGDANILSTPHLIATDNVEAEISVGQNVPLQTSAQFGSNLGGNLGALAALGGQGANQQGGLGALGSLGGLGFGGSVPRQDVGTTVTIIPHINASEEIRLEITEEISSAGAPSDTGNLGVVSIDRTRAKTEVVVRDQQTVVIGGLMRDQVTTSETKVPVLGDIPVLGTLFRTNRKQKMKKNLLLFLTPYIIRSPSDLRHIYDRKMRERQEFLDRYFVFGDPDYEPPVDYSRTRGLVAEIFLELDALAEQRKLLAEFASQPEPTHTARPAVGAAPDGSEEDEEDDSEAEETEIRIGPGEQGQAPPSPPEPGEAPGAASQQAESGEEE